MMKVSTKGRYGTRIMLELALQHDNKRPVLLREMSERQGISVKYIHLLISFLKRGGLVKSIRGPKGGYVLARAPSKISLREIVQTMEGTLSPVDCVDDPDFCDRIDFCAAHEVWKKLNRSILNVLDSLTLKDLIKMDYAKSSAKKDKVTLGIRGKSIKGRC